MKLVKQGLFRRSHRLLVVSLSMALRSCKSFLTPKFKSRSLHTTWNDGRGLAKGAPNQSMNPGVSSPSSVSVSYVRQRRKLSVRKITDLDDQEDEKAFRDLLPGDFDDILISEAASTRNDQGWVSIDWEKVLLRQVKYSRNDLCASKEIIPRSFPDRPSPVEKTLIRNRVVYFKRDDRLRLHGSYISGNKARKLYALNEIPPHQFPDCVVSYGGPQSNAMLALAAIVHSKNTGIKNLSQYHCGGIDKAKIEDPSQQQQQESDPTKDDKQPPTKRFVYFTKTIPRYLRSNPTGNFCRAKMLGMEIMELSNKEYEHLFGSTSGGKPEAPEDLSPPSFGNSLWVPQGGFSSMASPGVRLLAMEIVLFWLLEGQGKPLTVCLPGGTCSTALLLHREFQTLRKELREEKGVETDIRVLVIPCVGGDGYARRQMMALDVQLGKRNDVAAEDELPWVLSPTATEKYTGQSSGSHRYYYSFGEPHKEVLDTYREMMERCDIELDLLYGAPSWTLLLRHWRTSGSQDAATQPLEGREILYIHTGGLEGVSSQLARYSFKGLMEKG